MEQDENGQEAMEKETLVWLLACYYLLKLLYNNLYFYNNICKRRTIKKHRSFIY